MIRGGIEMATLSATLWGIQIVSHNTSEDDGGVEEEDRKDVKGRSRFE